MLPICFGITLCTGWTARFYVDDTVPGSIIDLLRYNHAEIVNMSGSNDMHGKIGGMFWRFLVADDDRVDRYIVRDTDSRLNARDRLAVEEWIRSGTGFHIIRDHNCHCKDVSGGMWGAKRGVVKVSR